ncbi:MAG: hypothetical protein K6C94_01775 [Candidatus Gastranaerophilales bacterium]|nr:hypothetical protein [Candidatus Gastranaerophilales bacterium]
MKKIIAYAHTHWDREWYREFEEFRLRLIEVVNDIIEKLSSGKLPVFYFDGQTSAIEDYLEIFPEKEQVIKKLIADKKLYIGPFFCSADQFLTGGESLLRNLKIGKEKSEELGCNNFLAYLSDTFGHCKSMPEILRCANLDKAVLWRGLGNRKADLNWNGIKTAYLIQGYFNDFLNSDIDFNKKAEDLKKYIDKIAEKSGEYVLLPIGADHLKTADDLKVQIEKLNKIYKGEYEITLSDPFEYFEKTETAERQYADGEFLDNSLNFILQGIYSTRNDIKQANFTCERKLLEAETFSAINSAFFKKENRQKQVDYAYKMLIKNHAHDSIYGCSTDKVCNEVLSRLTKTEEIADGIKKRCIRDLSGEKGVSAINLSNSDFNGVVTIETTKKLPSNLKAVLIGKKENFDDEILYNINKIPVTEDYTTIYKYAVNLRNIESFSVKNITKNDIFDEKDIKTGKNFFENEYFAINFKNGKIDFTDKKNQKIYHDFIKITDISEIGDSYNSAPIKNGKKIYAKLVACKITQKKFIAFADTEWEIKIPEKSTEKRRSLIAPKHKINMLMQINSGSNYVDFKCEYVNKSKDHKLQVVFNTQEPVTNTLSEDLFDVVERSFAPDFDINSQMPAPRGKEIKTNAMPINRFVFANGVGIITDGLKEAEIEGKNLAITLLRSTGIISNPKNASRGTPAGPPIPTPEMQMLGAQKAHFAVCFTDNGKELYTICDKIFNPPILFFGNFANKKFIRNDNPKIRVSAIKQNADNRLIVRLFNLSDEKEICTLKCGRLKLYETDLTETKSVPTNDILYFNPHEIKTVKFG